MSDEPTNLNQTKNIVICSDGTWQKGGQVTPTNVWRTYLAVEQDNQVKFHDDGVGAGGLKPYQIIGGAFGFGISRNIEDLVESLIKAYEPGARIFLFGFSRGAFTVRVLADLICRLGIPKSEGKSPEEIRELARTLLIYYKSLNTGRARHRSSPLFKRSKQHVPAAVVTEEDEKEFVKDVVQPQLETHTSTEGQGGDFAVHFIGCWDTVEAVGLPTDFLKKAAIRYFFPLRFSDQYPSPKVRHLYHALCLDDERHTFHPLLWQTPPNGLAQGQIMEQVWFMGGHSHVGGGYAKDQLAMEPLEWMLCKASAAGLRLNKELRDFFQSHAYRYGEMHPSRPWNSKFYRYQPRLLSESFKGKNSVPCDQDIEECRVHESVLDRVELGIDSYAPTAIDVNFKVVKTQEGELKSEIVDEKELPLSYRENMAVANHNYIRQGKYLYFACMLTWLVFGFWCYFKNSHIGGPQITKPQPMLEFVPEIINLGLHSIYSAEHWLLTLLTACVPAFIGDSALSWLKNLPGTLTCFAGVYALLLLYGGHLRRRALDHALRAWHGSGILKPREKSASEDIQVPWAFDSGTLMLSLTLVLGFCVAAVMGWRPYHAYLRADKAFHAKVHLDRISESHEVHFETAQPLFPTEVYVEEGETYEIQVRNLDDWYDKSEPVDSANGLAKDLWVHLPFRALRIGPRNPNEKIFQLNASVGVDGQPIGIGEKNRFTANQSGQLFLFVNDIPGFYANNHGTADVTITRVFEIKSDSPKDDTGEVSMETIPTSADP